MKHFALKASVAAVALAFAGLASAAPVDMDAAAPVAVKYASEQTVAGTVTLVDGANTDLTATVLTGASFGVQTQAYVRIDLTGGTFNAAPSIDVDDSSGVNNGSGSLSQGGTAASTYAVFQISPASTVGTEYINAAGSVSIDTNNIDVTAQTGVTLRYRLYETLTAAVNQTANTALKDKTVDYISFTPAVTVTTAQYDGVVTSAVADVSANTGAYTKFTGGGTELPLAKVTVTESGAVALHSGTFVAPGDIVANTNALSVTGDFTAARNDDGTYTGAALARVTLDASATCANAVAAANTLSGTAATFTGITAAQLAASRYLCLAAEGTPAIPAATYAGTLDLVPQAGFTLADASMNIGPVTRNGTTLKVPFATGKVGQGAWVQLTNTSANDASFTTTCYNTTGASAAGISGTVLAGMSKQIFAGALCSFGSSSAVMTFAVPAGSVVGSFVRQNSTSGDIGIDGMVGNQ